MEFINLDGVEDGDIIRLAPVQTTKQVVAVDTSAIRLGEFADGSLCALRGAVVQLVNGRYVFVRYGPFVFSLGGAWDAVSQSLVNLGLPPFAGEMNIDALLKRLRNILERWLQLNASSNIQNGLVLLDGSLTAGTPDNPSKDVERILEAGRRGGNVVIAISKKTRLRIQERPLTEQLDDLGEPSLIDVDGQVTRQFPPYPVRFLGRVFAGKLAKSGYAFRIDVDRQLDVPQAVGALQQLIGTDIVDQGYPETLRMAHVLSTFTASDVLAIQALAAANFGIQLLPRVALRRSLFGPFGTFSEAWH